MSSKSAILNSSRTHSHGSCFLSFSCVKMTSRTFNVRELYYFDLETSQLYFRKVMLCVWEVETNFWTIFTVFSPWYQIQWFKVKNTCFFVDNELSYFAALQSAQLLREVTTGTCVSGGTTVINYTVHGSSTQPACLYTVLLKFWVVHVDSQNVANRSNVKAKERQMWNQKAEIS